MRTFRIEPQEKLYAPRYSPDLKKVKSPPTEFKRANSNKKLLGGFKERYSTFSQLINSPKSSKGMQKHLLKDPNQSIFRFSDEIGDIRMKSSKLYAELDNQQFEVSQKIEIEKLAISEFFEEVIEGISLIRDKLVEEVNQEMEIVLEKTKRAKQTLSSGIQKIDNFLDKINSKRITTRFDISKAQEILENLKMGPIQKTVTISSLKFDDEVISGISNAIEKAFLQRSVVEIDMNPINEYSRAISRTINQLESANSISSTKLGSFIQNNNYKLISERVKKLLRPSGSPKPTSKSALLNNESHIALQATSKKKPRRSSQRPPLQEIPFNAQLISQTTNFNYTANSNLTTSELDITDLTCGERLELPSCVNALEI